MFHICTRTHSQKIAWWESPILSQMLIGSVRSPRSTNSFYPLTLSALPPSPSPSLPVSPTPVSADRYLLKIPDCTDNAHKVVECRFPQSKNGNPTEKSPSSSLLFNFYDRWFHWWSSEVGQKNKLADKTTLLFFFFFPSLSQKLKLSSKPVWEWRNLCGDWRLVHLRLQRRLGGSHVHPE